MHMTSWSALHSKINILSAWLKHLIASSKKKKTRPSSSKGAMQGTLHSFFKSLDSTTATPKPKAIEYSPDFSWSAENKVMDLTEILRLLYADAGLKISDMMKELRKVQGALKRATDRKQQELHYPCNAWFVGWAYSYCYIFILTRISLWGAVRC